MDKSLSVFADPRSVAVVGASGDPAKWGYWLARGALRGAARRAVYLVNAKSAVIEGVRSYPSLRDLPEPPELVVLCAPAAGIPAVVDEALALGVKGFLGITAGIDTVSGEPGLERRLADRIRAAGARLVGPNCLGLYDADHQLELAWGSFHPGSLAVVSQSGQLGLEIAGLAAHAGLGVSRFVSVGNQVDVTAADLLDDLVDHETTRAVVLYLESFAAGRDLVARMARLRSAGKPVVVLTVGASEASRVAARSHTGAMTASADVVAAACRAAGAVLVETPAQAVDLAHLLAGSPLPRGRRVAVVSDSGGQGALAADILCREGLTVPRLSAGTSDSLAAFLPAAAAVANPVDLAGAGEQDLDTYSHVVEVLLASGEVDAVVMSGYFGSYGSDTPALVDRELEVVEMLAGSVRRHDRPIVVHSMSHDSAAVRSMRAQAVPTLHTIDAVARSLGLAAELFDRAADQLGADGLTVPAGQAATVGGSRPVDQAASVGRSRPVGRAVPAEPAVAAVGEPMAYLAGRDRLARRGVPYPKAVAVSAVDEIRAAAAAMTGPFVLKAGWLEHKTDVGGVVVGLADVDAAVAAFSEMSGRLGAGGYVLEEMDVRADAVELIVGSRRDRSFGPLVLVGLGGVQAELYRDVQLALAPVTEQQARRMLESLRAYPLLRGWRGRPPVDADAAARVVAAVSRLIAEEPDVVECEINPLRVAPDGAVAVDALVLAALPGDDVAPDSALTGAKR